MDLFAQIQNCKGDDDVKRIKKDIKSRVKKKEKLELLLNGDNRDTLLHAAARYCPDLISTLVKVIDIDAINKHSITPMHVAAKYNKDSVKKLGKYDVEVMEIDSQKNTPLHYAAKFNQDCVKSLLKLGADANAKNNDGKTPLDLLEITRREATVEVSRKK
jgi:ankyrin repeat protein